MPINEIVTGNPSLVMPAGTIRSRNPASLAMMAPEPSPLIKTIIFIREMEGGEDGLVDLIGSPASDMSAAMEENLAQADDASIVDFDAGIADRADGDGQSNPLQERKVDVDIEPLRLEARETVGDVLEHLTDCIEMVQAFLETKVAEVV
jgi:hypothetical protein